MVSAISALLLCRDRLKTPPAIVHHAARFDLSAPLASMGVVEAEPVSPDCEEGWGAAPSETQAAPSAAAALPATTLEQKSRGARPPAVVIVSFDGLGAGFTGPQGTAAMRNPSDNSLAVGPNHVVQTVNSRLAVFTQNGEPIYGPVVTNSIFKGFGGPCETSVSGDAVVRYDQLARRWLFVLPVFRRIPDRPEELYSMCYAVSTGEDPLGSYHRYEFRRKLFPDYPRPAVWPDGYYIPPTRATK